MCDFVLIFLSRLNIHPADEWTFKTKVIEIARHNIRQAELIRSLLEDFIKFEFELMELVNEEEGRRLRELYTRNMWMSGGISGLYDPASIATESW